MPLNPFDRMPHEPEAEAALLGALVLCGSHARREPTIAALRRDAFFIPSNALMFEAIRGLHVAGVNVDSVTLRDALRASGKLEEAGGAGAIASLLQSCPSHEHIESYSDAVTRCWRLRFVASACDRAAGLAAAGVDVDPIQLAGDLSGKLNQLLLRAASNAPRIDPTADLEDRISAAVRGELRPLPLPWPKLNLGTHALLPGSTTVLCAEPGVGKSRFVMQAMENLQSHKVKCAALMLEGSRGEHLARALVMLERDVRFGDPEFMRREERLVRGVKALHEASLAKLGEAIWDQPSSPMTLDDLAAWAHGRALEGARVLFIDPITAAAAGQERYIEDAATMRSLIQTAERFECSIFLTTHPRGGTSSKPSLDNMACGRCYPRSAWNVFWLRRHKPARLALVQSSYGPEIVDVNAELIVLKARHSWGSDCSFALDDDRARSLTFNERGLITKWDPDEADEAKALADARAAVDPFGNQRDEHP